MTENNHFHTSVLCKESIDLLQIDPNGIYVDATLGGGGHSRAILTALDRDKGKLIVIDQDKNALDANTPNDKRIIAVHANFTYIRHFLKYHGIKSVNGVIADLGVSSHQFDTGDRGFSIMYDGPLDMRMNRQQTLTAQYIIEKYDADELKQMFQNYGEVSNTNTLVSAILQAREKMKIETTETLVRIAEQVARGENKMQYLAKVFQAIRIEVNNEIGNLEKFVSVCGECMVSGGRLAVISFHSLEDRVVKNSFKHAKDDRGKAIWKPLFPKPIMAEGEELKMNRRARSAKLRVGIKL